MTGRKAEPNNAQAPPFFRLDSEQLHSPDLKLPHLPHMKRSATVVGGGIMGLSTAHVLASRGYAVTVVAKDFSPRTTSDAAGGLWRPYAVGSDERIARWGGVTLERLRELNRAAPAEWGVAGVAGYELSVSPPPTEPWQRQVAGYRHVGAEELARLGLPTEAAAVWYSSFIVETTRYMDRLTEDLLAAGVGMRVDVVSGGALDSLPGDVVVNCAGVGGAAAAGDDPVATVPGRGVVVRVRAPWMTYMVSDERPADDALAYVLPRGPDVVLGGINLQGNADEGPPTDEEVRGVIERCGALVPGLANAPILSVAAGTRPRRDPARLERHGRVVHCYGHSGAGITLHWGCAQEAAALCDELLA